MIIPRDALVQQFVDTLRTTSVILHGARRVGKSTLLQQIVETPPHGVVMVRLDLEGFLAEPVEQLSRALHDVLVQRELIRTTGLTDRVESVEVGGVGLTLRERPADFAWTRIEKDLVAAVVQLPEEQLLVVALDELPWWLDALTDREGPAQARAALAALRRIRQLRPVADRVRMVFTGSIGLAGLASDLEASAELNDLQTIAVPPMDDAQGAALFETDVSARGLTCDPGSAKHATQMAGGSPHWIKVLAAGVQPPVSERAVDDTIDRLLAPAQRRLFADEGREHFQRRHPALLPVMAAILEALSGSDGGHPLEAAVTAALSEDPSLTRRRAEDAVWLLVDGFYLLPEGATLRWVNPLFRRWWLRYGGP